MDANDLTRQPGIERDASVHSPHIIEPGPKRRATLMSYEMAVGLLVVDQESYSQYRKEMRPLLEDAGGAFRYDFEVARVLRSEDGGAEINRAFVLHFPSKSSKERFFADPRYIEIRRRFFDPAVKARVLIAEYLTDATA
jgi:uncharacterized protein (DUF1330 family)